MSLNNLLSFSLKRFAYEKADECKCSVHTILLVAKLHFGSAQTEVKTKSAVSDFILQPPCSPASPGADEPIIVFIDAKVSEGLLPSCFDHYASAVWMSVSVILG